MKNNFRKFKILPFILSVILLFASSGIFFLIWRATQGNVKESADMETAWLTEEGRREEMQTLEHTLTTLAKERAEIDAHFIKSSDIVPFANLIDRLGPEVGAQTEVTALDPAKDGLSLMVGVKSTGTFEATYKFLKLLENSPYELEVVSLDMQSIGASSAEEEGAVAPRLWTGTFRVKLLSFLP